jgi:hypothetical protein
MANSKGTKGGRIIYKTLHRKIKIEQHAPQNDGESHDNDIVMKIAYVFETEIQWWK